MKFCLSMLVFKFIFIYTKEGWYLAGTAWPTRIGLSGLLLKYAETVSWLTEWIFSFGFKYL